MSDELTPLVRATNDYVAANEALTEWVRTGGSVGDGVEIIRAEREARVAYAKELEVAGHAVPIGLLDY